MRGVSYSMLINYKLYIFVLYVSSIVVLPLEIIFIGLSSVHSSRAEQGQVYPDELKITQV